MHTSAAGAYKGVESVARHQSRVVCTEGRSEDHVPHWMLDQIFCGHKVVLYQPLHPLEGQLPLLIQSQLDGRGPE